MANLQRLQRGEVGRDEGGEDGRERDAGYSCLNESTHIEQLMCDGGGGAKIASSVMDSF